MFIPAPLLLSALASEGLNVSWSGGNLQEMELDGGLVAPPFQYIVLSCVYISGVNMVTHSALGSLPPPLTPVKFGFRSNWSLSPPPSLTAPIPEMAVRTRQGLRGLECWWTWPHLDLILLSPPPAQPCPKGNWRDEEKVPCAALS